MTKNNAKRLGLRSTLKTLKEKDLKTTHFLKKKTCDGCFEVSIKCVIAKVQSFK